MHYIDIGVILSWVIMAVMALGPLFGRVRSFLAEVFPDGEIDNLVTRLEEGELEAGEIVAIIGIYLLYTLLVAVIGLVSIILWPVAIVAIVLFIVLNKKRKK